MAGGIRALNTIGLDVGDVLIDVKTRLLAA